MITDQIKELIEKRLDSGRPATKLKINNVDYSQLKREMIDSKKNIAGNRVLGLGLIVGNGYNLEVI